MILISKRKSGKKIDNKRGCSAKNQIAQGFKAINIIISSL